MAADIQGVSRFSPDTTDRPAYLVASIVALANRTITLAVDAAVETARAEAAGDARGFAEQVSRLAAGAFVATGQEDGLFRELGIDFKLTEPQIKLLNSSAGRDQLPLKTLALNLNVKLSDYGTSVTIQEPANPQPTKALGGALLGALFSMTG